MPNTNLDTAIANCTSDIAAELGITPTSAIDTQNHETVTIFGGNTMPDLKTYDSTYDSQNHLNAEICITSKDQHLNVDVVYPKCSVIFQNPGYIKLPSDKSSCVTYDCPPGWERDRSFCKKPLVDAILDKRSRCDQRWYDWIAIPNYHLGNNFIQGSNIGICYAPCPPENVPYYTNDPVKSMSDLPPDINSDPNINRCIAKTDYLMGEYANTPEFCPLAWVFRTYYQTSTGTEALKDKLTSIYNTSNINIDPTNYNRNSLTHYKNGFVPTNEFYYMLQQDNKDNAIIASLNNDASGSGSGSGSRSGSGSGSGSRVSIQNPKNTDVYNRLISKLGLTNTTADIKASIGSYIDNIPEKFDKATCDACNSLNTTDRLNDAYSICSYLYNNTDIDDGSPQYQVLKQSCNALFCDKLQKNYNSTSANFISFDPICFVTSQITDLYLNNSDDPQPVKTDSDRKHIKFYLAFAVAIVLAPILIAIIVLIYNKVIYPYIISPFIRQIQIWFAGFSPSSVALLSTLTKGKKSAD